MVIKFGHWVLQVLIFLPIMKSQVFLPKQRNNEILHFVTIVRFDNLEDASNNTEESLLNNANYVDPYPQSSLDLQHTKNIYDPKLMVYFENVTNIFTYIHCIERI